MRRLATTILAATACLTMSCAASFAQDDVTKSKLSFAEANAEILLKQGAGYGVKAIGVTPNGKEYTITFSKNLKPGRFGLAVPPAALDKEVFAARKHGGVIFTQLKGFNRNNKIYYAFVTRVIGPKGSANFEVRRDVPAQQFRAFVVNEQKKGGRLVDTSTYQNPNGDSLHTAVLHPR